MKDLKLSRWKTKLSCHALAEIEEPNYWKKFEPISSWLVYSRKICNGQLQLIH